MILHDLHIENFRGMQHVHFHGLAPLSVVVGSNNAGKSSALEAATLLLRPFDPSQWVQVARIWSLFPTDTPLCLDTALLIETPPRN
jgi:predicted ATP-dependent endonuclease of OLD family